MLLEFYYLGLYSLPILFGMLCILGNHFLESLDIFGSGNIYNGGHLKKPLIFFNSFKGMFIISFGTASLLSFLLLWDFLIAKSIPDTEEEPDYYKIRSVIMYSWTVVFLVNCLYVMVVIPFQIVYSIVHTYSTIKGLIVIAAIQFLSRNISDANSCWPYCWLDVSLQQLSVVGICVNSFVASFACVSLLHSSHMMRIRSSFTNSSKMNMNLKTSLESLIMKKKQLRYIATPPWLVPTSAAESLLPNEGVLSANPNPITSSFHGLSLFSPSPRRQHPPPGRKMYNPPNYSTHPSPFPGAQRDAAIRSLLYM